ncbi:MAG: hypothetical protein R2827_08910 [Bdellovibrionales bacterium]
MRNVTGRNLFFQRNLMGHLSVITLITSSLLLVSCKVGSTFSSSSVTFESASKIKLSSAAYTVTLQENNVLSVLIVGDKKAPSDTTINWSIENGQDDFVATQGSQTLLAGSDSINVQVNVIDDNLYEVTKSLF